MTPSRVPVESRHDSETENSRPPKAKLAGREEQHRALALLARSPHGCPESLLVHGHGVSIEVLVELINSGLASVRLEWVSQPRMEVTHVEITDAGREAIGVSR